jgi:hypothetical protein
MAAVCSSETSVKLYRITRHYVTKDSTYYRLSVTYSDSKKRHFLHETPRVHTHVHKSASLAFVLRHSHQVNSFIYYFTEIFNIIFSCTPWSPRKYHRFKFSPTECIFVLFSPSLPLHSKVLLEEYMYICEIYHIMFSSHLLLHVSSFLIFLIALVCKQLYTFLS